MRRPKKTNDDLVVLSFNRLNSDSGPNSSQSSPVAIGYDEKLQPNTNPMKSLPIETPPDLNYPSPVGEPSLHEQIVQSGDPGESEKVKVETVEKDGGENGEETAFEEKTDLGLIFNILKLCLTRRQATFGVIFLAFILNASDAFSDYSLAFYLYNTGFLTAASLILLIDYGVFFISLSHYLMSHLAEASWLSLTFNSLFLILLHPFAPGLSALYWFIIRARRLNKEDSAHYFLKMTSVIQGCAEAPSQIVATSWMILTHQLEAPWTKQSEVCDSWGNCVAFGVVLSVGSLGLSWISLLKASLDSFQSADVVSALCLLLPSLIFRLGSSILLFTYLEVSHAKFANCITNLCSVSIFS